MTDSAFRSSLSARAVNPFGRIVVGYDESPASAAALSAAALYARDAGGELAIVHVSDVAPAASLLLETAGSPTDGQAGPLLASVGPDNRALYERLRPQVSDMTVPVKLEFCSGEPAVALLDAAARWKATAIAVGTHGRTGLAHAFFGSVAEAVVQRSSLPIIVAREGVLPQALRRIVVGIDASGPSADACALVLRLASDDRLRVVFCSVIDTSDLENPAADLPFDPTPLLHQMEAGARDALEAVVLRAEARGVFADTAIATAREPAAGLVDVARRQGADAIVVGTHRRGPVARFMLGSTAETLLRIADAPVIVVPQGTTNEGSP